MVGTHFGAKFRVRTRREIRFLSALVTKITFSGFSNPFFETFRYAPGLGSGGAEFSWTRALRIKKPHVDPTPIKGTLLPAIRHNL